MVKIEEIDESEELNEEEKAALMRAVDSMTNKSMDTIKKVLIIPFIFAIGCALKIIPNLTRNLYKQPSYYEQSFTAFINSVSSDAQTVLAPGIYCIIPFIIMKCRGTMFVAFIISFIFLLSEPSLALASLNATYSATIILYLIAFYVSQNLLLVNPYSLKWFGYYISTAVISCIVAFTTANFLGAIIGLYMAVFISSLSRFGEAKGSKVKLVVEVILLIVTSYVVIIPVSYLLQYLRSDKESCNLVRPYPKNVHEYLVEWDAHPSYVELAVTVSAIFFLFFGRYRYLSIVPLIQIVVGIIATYNIQLETPGESAAYRFFIFKLLCMIASGIIFSALKIPALAQIILGLILAIQVVYRVSDFGVRVFG